jgi:hypothetical protein
MASVSKSVSGTTTTFTVTDQANNAATMVVSATNTGLTVQFSGAAVYKDAVALMSQMMLQLQTGVIPGAGAEGLNP